jgi:Putative bacterial sensory transduction regulator
MKEPIHFFYTLFEDAIESLNVSPATARAGQPGKWVFKIGSASIWVDIIPGTDTTGVIQMLAPVCNVPASNQLMFAKELLESNYTLFGASFAIHVDKVYIRSIRELEGIDKSEITNSLLRVGKYADAWDDKLKTKYFSNGGKPA